MRRNSIVLVLLVALAGLGASGCGGADKQEYIKENNKIQTKVGKGISSLDPSDPAAIKSAQKQLDGAATDLDDLDIPSDYSDEHDKMVGSIEDLSGIMGDLGTAMEKKDTEALSDIQTRLATAQKTYNTAISDMNADR
ncbi:MAG: hypothetical protein JWM90_1927 [Thermoleophilia bacterium]|nr:hypothetical protein [Thermoleophilia bacterium]